jgi:hypothetical protein
MPTYRCKNPPIHTPRDQHRFGSQSFLACDLRQVEPMGGNIPKNIGLDLAIALS